VSLWEWAGRAWARPGFEAACLALQEKHGQCVPLVLWALWLAEDKRTPDPAAAETAIVFCRSIDASKIQRLRNARRAAAPMDRAVLLQRELGAERHLMDRLESISLSDARAFVDPAVTLAAISARWGSPLDPTAFASLTGEAADVG
jgi:uncharacterized protein (TIGR02444 family)